MKKTVVALVLAWAPLAAAQVQVSEGTIELPTDEEGPPDVNPPFASS